MPPVVESVMHNSSTGEIIMTLTAQASRQLEKEIASKDLKFC